MNDTDALSFEAAFAELEAILDKLDSGNLPLDESVALYERGRRLTARCQTLLDEAELRVSKLMDDGRMEPL
jgi:exodeoxyribonuclease VII small subunit